ncbi:MAG: methyltransferase domain-containing protein [Clostridiales bacterium]|jgi:cyclopropane fatty-acyl-phospholipid synthase-like methyltransferase|nr:methyltransferase domain-containing protein [Clostridiales bacterium]
MKRYPKTEKYDSDWISKNWMGPNPLWLLEELCGNLELKPGMRVLDMGCGKGLTSVFLAREYGVTVFANDLWISATNNLKRFEEAGVSGCVFPIHAEAHALPYADGFFDAAISIDSYQYYGTDEIYFPTVYSKLIKSGGQFGIVVPGFVKEFDRGRPDTLAALWQPDMYTFHSGAWWRALWEKTGFVEITACYDMESPKEVWRPWAEWCKGNFNKEFGGGDDGEDDLETKFLDADVNNDIALVVMAARKKG